MLFYVFYFQTFRFWWNSSQKPTWEFLAVFKESFKGAQIMQENLKNLHHFSDSNFSNFPVTDHFGSGMKGLGLREVGKRKGRWVANEFTLQNSTWKMVIQLHWMLMALDGTWSHLAKMLWKSVHKRWSSMSMTLVVKSPGRANFSIANSLS